MLQEIIATITDAHRMRRDCMASRIMQTNRLRALVARAEFGYHAGLPEAVRGKAMDAADALILAVTSAPESPPDRPTTDLILQTSLAAGAIEGMEAAYAKVMERAARRLPVAMWVTQPEQRGFGMLSLAMVVGECGDLTFRGHHTVTAEDDEGGKVERVVPVGYPNPAKLWRRMGCAPCDFRGAVLMPSSLMRLQGRAKPNAEEWSAIGYCPRRRSLAYLIGEALIKLNFQPDAADDGGKRPGPYRQRYLEAKARFAAAEAKRTPKHCDTHGKLCAVKLLLKNLWIEWKRLAVEAGDWCGGEGAIVTDNAVAAAPV